jgi:hypothetical protein
VEGSPASIRATTHTILWVAIRASRPLRTCGRAAEGARVPRS